MDGSSIGFVFALSAVFFWGSSLAPLKLSRSPDGERLILLSLSALAVSLIAFIAFPEPLSLPVLASGFAGGVLWALASRFAIRSIEEAGVARSSAILCSIQVLATFAVGAFAFGEFPSGSLPKAVAGVVALAASAVVVSLARENPDGKSGGQSALNSGIAHAVFAALLWSAYLIPLKLSGSAGLTAPQLGISLGILASCLLMFRPFAKAALSKLGRDWPPLASGAMWALGNLSAILAIGALGFARGFPLTQLNVFLGVAWGVLYFKEAASAKSLALILLAAVMALAGSLLLMEG